MRSFFILDLETSFFAYRRILGQNLKEKKKKITPSTPFFCPKMVEKWIFGNFSKLESLIKKPNVRSFTVSVLWKYLEIFNVKTNVREFVGQYERSIKLGVLQWKDCFNGFLLRVNVRDLQKNPAMKLTHIIS